MSCAHQEQKAKVAGEVSDEQCWNNRQGSRLTTALATMSAHLKRFHLSRSPGRPLPATPNNLPIVPPNNQPPAPCLFPFPEGSCSSYPYSSSFLPDDDLRENRGMPIPLASVLTPTLIPSSSSYPPAPSRSLPPAPSFHASRPAPRLTIRSLVLRCGFEGEVAPSAYPSFPNGERGGENVLSWNRCRGPCRESGERSAGCGKAPCPCGC